ncbi:hypothetical protein HDU76_006717 [Blyttiomyces sp. JEL0837]|nr:hypothetical protein HDU76_006717 [Blyttiomyces sp. JEL0837]
MNAQPSRVLQGQKDTDINSTGHAQSLAIARRLKKEKFDHFYSSDLKRSVQTLEEIKKHHPDTPTTLDPRLREKDLGDLTGLTWAEAKKILKKEDRHFEDHVKETGESDEQFRQRVLDVYGDLILDYVAIPHRQLLGLETPMRASLATAPISSQIANTPGSQSATAPQPAIMQRQQSEAQKELARLSATLDKAISLNETGINTNADNNANAANLSLKIDTANPRMSISGSPRSALPSPLPHPSLAKDVSETALQTQSELLSAPAATNSTSSSTSAATNPAQTHLKLKKLKRRHILIVTHGGWIHQLMDHLIQDLGFEILEHNRGFPKNTGLYQFQISKWFWRDGDYDWMGTVSKMNSMSHLANLGKHLAAGANGSNQGSIVSSAASSVDGTPQQSPFQNRKALYGKEKAGKGKKGRDMKDLATEAANAVTSTPRKSLGW